eukprot:CAMPEP_0115380912 /NCGR_PEP_ID=MMETSP0271-20121206/5295_1 /TAXON_ID=71861 /ORGANISM="Scrippsiella trochoidea, Strain CCMP3099" /LENGTH=55 /DNA_ID=CAMNT_0002804167 /DNA_START=35 /DNA_END=202 /DNA_ORIENTATION=-
MHGVEDFAGLLFSSTLAALWKSECWRRDGQRAGKLRPREENMVICQVSIMEACRT